MDVAIITGDCGLIGSQAALFLGAKNFKVVGIDNDMRQYFFGKEASTKWVKAILKKGIAHYEHHDVDIRDWKRVEKIFNKYSSDIKLVIHTAAQPSHDWAAREPLTDFSVNANGTLNLLELTRKYAPKAVFEFLSTNKVYGDLPNGLPLVEEKTRFELPQPHRSYNGIDESMSIDQSKHSLFGASKVAADIMVQEYGRYFNMKTVCFRGGCLTGPNHSGAALHGFLAYLMKCCVTGTKYTIYGYKGKQVRDNIHSHDLVQALFAFYQKPRVAEVYNLGGGRKNSCSVLEAIALCEGITKRKLNFKLDETNRSGDHKWYISSLAKFKDHYPGWDITVGLNETLRQIYEQNVGRWE